MTFVLIRKGLLLEGSNPKIEDTQVPGILIYYIHIKLLPTVPGPGGHCYREGGSLSYNSPRKLTCPLKRGHFKRNFIFRPSNFRRYVSFQGGNKEMFHPKTSGNDPI